jgi:hypothetical protein
MRYERTLMTKADSPVAFLDGFFLGFSRISPFIHLFWRFVAITVLSFGTSLRTDKPGRKSSTAKLLTAGRPQI